MDLETAEQVARDVKYLVKLGEDHLSKYFEHYKSEYYIEEYDWYDDDEEWLEGLEFSDIGGGCISFSFTPYCSNGEDTLIICISLEYLLDNEKMELHVRHTVELRGLEARMLDLNRQAQAEKEKETRHAKYKELKAEFGE